MSQASVTEVINLMSEQILTELSGLSQRQWYPTYDPDDDDKTMKDRRERANKLRELRRQYEDLMTGVV